MKGREKVLSLEPLLSKALDSLCMQLTLTTKDENSLGLLDILDWRLKGQITRDQFSQLYCGWLEAKNINETLVTSQQQQSYDKAQLYGADRLPKDMLSIVKVSSMLEWLNDQYNMKHLQKYNEPQLIQAIERVFSYLDAEGIIHLRTSQLIFITMAFILVGKIQFTELSTGNLQQKFEQFKSEINIVEGKVSLRAFKNYLSRKYSTEAVNEMAKQLREIQKRLNCRDCLPNIFTQAFNKYKSMAKHESQKRKIEILQRIFEEHEHIFFIESADEIELVLQQYYGHGCLKLYNIQLQNIKEFQQYLHGQISKYYTLFLQLFQTELNKFNQETSRIKSIKTKGLSQNSSILGSRKVYTPMRKLNRSQSASKQAFVKQINRSVERLSRSVMNQTPPKKRSLPDVIGSKTTKNVSSPINSWQTTEIQKLEFFRNKKVEPFEVVMRRLKQK